MPTLESLTVEQLAALCGLTRDDDVNLWVDPNGSPQRRRLVASDWMGNHWNAWPNGTVGRRIDALSEHAALVALAKHLNLTPTPKDGTMPTYKRLDRDPKTDDYVDYAPKPGDRWHFGRGPVWICKSASMVGPENDEGAHVPSEYIRALTTHIERPVKVRDVRGPGYEPKPGDVLCGPDGPLFVVSFVSPGGLPHVTPVGRSVPEVGLAVEHFALCTRIEREE